MNALIKSFAAATTLTLTLLVMSRAHGAPAGQVDFGSFNAGDTNSEFVEIRVSKNLINLAARLLEKQEPEVAKLLGSVDGVRVNVIGLDDSNRKHIVSRALDIRNNLENSGWDKVVTVKKQNEDVGVYLKADQKETVEGVTVVVMQDNKEAVFINVIGNIKPEQLSILGERLHIEALKKAGTDINPQS